MNRSTAISAILLTLTAAAAHAQPASAQPRYYADIGTVADFDPNAFGDSPTATPSIKTSIGAALPHRWTTRFELTIPKWHDESFTYTCGCTGRQSTASGTDRHRITTYDFLVGRDLTLGSRVHVTPLIGFSAAQHADREDETITTASRVVDSNSEDHQEFIASMVWGVDLAVAISRHASIVPQFRMNAFPQYEGARAIFRPGVALRIGF
jgi:hypothetical protein